MTTGLSIIIACYNKEKNIQMTIESIQNQTIVKKNEPSFVEIICIDDCSTDNSYKILNDLSSKYKNLVIMKNPTNSSVFVSRIKGIKKATKGYITFVDPDDWLDETYFEELYEAAIKSKADIIQTPSVVKVLDNNRREYAYSWFSNMRDKTSMNVNPDNFNKIISGNWLTMWNRMFKSDKIKKLENFPPYYINFLEDILIYLAVLVVSNKVYNVKTKGAYYYNLTNECEHLSKPKAFNSRSAPTAQVFQLLDAFLLETGSICYHENITKFRRSYIMMFSREYSNMFTMTEKFRNDYIEGFVSADAITPNDRRSEFEYVRKIYVELLKSNY